jgi:histidine triad (HIT) family protein
MSDCIFCKILVGKEESSIIYQDEICTALLDIEPITPGHTLIIPNRHAMNLANLDEQTGAHLFRIAQRVAAAIGRSVLKCEGVNLLLSDGEVAGQEVFHTHLHVLPRFKGDGFGFKLPSECGIKAEREELDAVAEQIRKAF